MPYYIKITSYQKVQWTNKIKQETAKDPSPWTNSMKVTGRNQAKLITIPNSNYSKAHKKSISSIDTVSSFKNCLKN